MFESHPQDWGVFTLAVRQRLAKGAAGLRCLAGSVLDPSAAPRNDTGERFSCSASIV